MVRRAKNISAGSMRVSNFVRIFWLIHREAYRCHLGNFYRYSKGAWILRDEKKFDTYHFTEITQACEGIFVALSRKKVEYERACVAEAIRSMDLGSITTWQSLALVSADNSNSSTGGGEIQGATVLKIRG